MSTRSFLPGLFMPVLVVALVVPARGQVSSDDEHLRELDAMIDAMASRNPAPKAGHGRPTVSRDYDWSEQKRVWKAIKAVKADTSYAMRKRLRAHYDDKRYAVTLVFDGDVNSKNVSVGDVCKAMPGPDYDAAYAKHFPKVIGELYNFHPARVVEEHEEEWKDRPHYELQIEVCEEAIRQMAKLTSTSAIKISPANDYQASQESHVFTAEEKAAFTEAVRKEIEELKRTKEPVVRPERPLRIFFLAWEPLKPQFARRASEPDEEKPEDRKAGNETSGSGMPGKTK